MQKFLRWKQFVDGEALIYDSIADEYGEVSMQWIVERQVERVELENRTIYLIYYIRYGGRIQLPPRRLPDSASLP